ncbi:sperm flagellar protein 1-like isoform X14 [Ostrea edulis]|uniref:sperm flagellar protein 1-like isoform X14 n=1 Tax=Ostrea edulis TaxID=37623 RepID=UPI002094152C|nr:sperm flagellar protein 1-like isoform X14 [Ostrea edulis]
METITFRRQMNGLTRVDMEEYFDDVELENLYQWIDRIPLSRPKKNVGKDFSDGVLIAEIINHYFPKLVELHNYSPAAATKQKMENWYLLNRRVLRKLDLDLSDEVIRALANCKPKVVEKVLMLLRLQIDRNLQRQEALVPVKTGRSSPGKLASPRKLGKGEIPHNHPDRSIGVKIKGGSDDFGSYHFESRGFYDPSIYLYPTTDNVPRSYLEEKEMECLAKDETIRILNSKIRRLEHLIQLKDTRLLELQGQYSREQRLYYMAARNNILR